VPGALIAKPIVLDLTLLLPCTDERRRGEFAGPGDAASLDQKQLAISQSEKWFGALQIGASAEHIAAASCPVQHDHGKTIAASKWLHKHLSYHHLDLPAFCDYAANQPSLVASAVSIILALCLLIGNSCRYFNFVGLLKRQLDGYHYYDSQSSLNLHRKAI
jgi:hypothetical protein